MRREENELRKEKRDVDIFYRRGREKKKKKKKKKKKRVCYEMRDSGLFIWTFY